MHRHTMILVNGMSRSTKRIFGSIGIDDVSMGLDLHKFGFHLSSNQFFMDLILNPLESLLVGMQQLERFYRKILGTRALNHGTCKDSSSYDVSSSWLIFGVHTPLAWNLVFLNRSLVKHLTFLILPGPTKTSTYLQQNIRSKKKRG